jgi:L-ascorbate metabolism protein UlaG (beta-lactamase superfamily)
MSFVVKMNGVIIYFDPFLNDFTDETGAGRGYEPPFPPGRELDADYFICSHNHADHLNLATLLPQAQGNPRTRFIVPRPFTSLLIDAGIEKGRVTGAQSGLTLELDGDLTLSPIAAAHTLYETDENGDELYLGYVLNGTDRHGKGCHGKCCHGKGCRIYHSGDTIVTPRLIETLNGFRPLNIAILPINGGDWERTERGIIANMTVEDAAKLAHAIDTDLVIPGHYDLLGCNAVNPALFAEAMYRLSPAKKYHIFAPGECFRYHF